MKILVRAPNWLGDQVLAFPFFYYLRKQFPQAHIVSACVDWVADIQFRDLIDEVFVLPRAESKRLHHRFRAVHQGALELGQKHQFDLAISMPNSFSAAYFIHKVGAKVRRGYTGDLRGFLLNEKIPWDSAKDLHRAQAYAKLLPEQASRGIDVKTFWGEKAESDLDQDTPGELPSFPAEKNWNVGVDPIKPPQGKYWVLAPGATAISRRWPVLNFARLASTVSKELGIPGIIVGGRSEIELAQELCENPALKLRDFTARGSVAELWQIFRNSEFTVTNESGLAHVASLCGAPVQIVCGAADPRRTKPLGPGLVQVTVNPVECWPCERNTCFQSGDKEFQCLKGIVPENVWQEMKSGFQFQTN